MTITRSRLQGPAILADGLQRYIADRDQPFLATLPFQTDNAVGFVEVIEIDPDDFTHPRAGRIHGFQQGTVTGQENPVDTIYSQRFYEVAKNITLSQHVYSPRWVAIAERNEERGAAVEGDDVAVESEREFGLSVLRRLDAEVLIDAINKVTGSSDLYTSPIPEPNPAPVNGVTARAARSRLAPCSRRRSC